jgi:hypothetical protein
MKMKQNGRMYSFITAIYKQDIVVCKISINSGMAKKPGKINDWAESQTGKTLKVF